MLAKVGTRFVVTAAQPGLPEGTVVEVAGADDDRVVVFAPSPTMTFLEDEGVMKQILQPQHYGMAAADFDASFKQTKKTLPTE